MNLKLVKALIVPLIFSLYSSRVNSTNGKAEPPSAFSLFYQTQDSIYQKKYEKATKLFAEGEYLESLSEAIIIVENSKKIEEKISATKLIGEVYENINNHKKAIHYYKKVLTLIDNKSFLLEKKESDVLSLRAKILLKIGGIYQFIPQADSAKFYLDKILLINSFNKEIRLRKADAHNNLSTIYYYDKGFRDLSKAKYHANKSIEIHKDLRDNQSLSADYGNLASIFMEEGELEEAKRLYQKALGFIKNDNRLKAVKYREALYDNLGWTLYNLKDYVAYDYLDKSVAIRDSLTNLEINKNIAELEILHNNEKQLIAIESQKKLAQRNTWLVAGIGITVVLLLFYLTNYYKLRQRNLSLELSQNELKQQKSIEKLKSEAQNKILNATLDGKEAERKQIAETLHDNVSALLSSANLHLQATQKQFNGSVPSELEKTQEIILLASKQIRDLSHNLVSSVLLKFGLHYAAKDAAEKFSNSEIKFHTQLENLNRYNKDFEIKVYNIMQEFLNNILKHSKADSALIRLREINSKLILSIEDNGIGFNAQEIIEKGGIGLNQITARIKVMDGTLTIDSEKNQGTKIKIVIPIVEKEEVSFV